MSLARQRVVVTGLGAISSLGTGVPSFWDGVASGRSGVRRLAGLGAPGLADPIGADVEALIPPERRSGAPAARVAQLALAAGLEAFRSAGLERCERRRGGVIVGTGFGGLATSEETYRDCFTHPGHRPRPTVIPAAMANASSGLLATELRLKGPNLTLALACSSGTHAIGQAFRMLGTGEADLMIAGGADAPLTPIILAAWNAMRVLAPAGADPARACRPFHRDRQGIVVGEGAGFVVLETLAHAEARGAPVLAEVLGYGANADAGHITHPDLEGVRSCMALGLDDAGLGPAAVGYVNAHGTGTAVNDRVEALALAELFGEHARHLLVSSTKAVHGHAMGASGGLEVIATVLAMAEGRVPPTANLDQVDPELPLLDFVAGSARKAAVQVAMSCSFAFGGNNAVVVLGRS